MKAQLMGKDDKRVSQIVCEHYKLPIKSDEFYDEVKNRLAAELPFCSLVDGVENLIHLIHSLGNIEISIFSIFHFLHFRCSNGSSHRLRKTFL